MFQATVSPSDLLSAINPVHVIVDECKIHVYDSGLEIRAVDESQVGMIDLESQTDLFETLDVSHEILGLKLDKLVDAVSIIDENEDVEYLEMYTNDDGDKLHLQGEEVEYDINLVDAESIRDEPDMPNLGIDGRIELDAKKFTRGIDATTLVDQHVYVGIDEDENSFYMRAEGDTDDGRYELDEGKLLESNLVSGEALFGGEYLEEMFDPIPDDSPVAIEIGPEYPIKIHFEAVDGIVDVTYLMAPRIPTSDDDT